MLSNNLKLLHLSLIPGVGPGLIKRIIEEKLLRELYYLREKDFAYYLGSSANKLYCGLKNKKILIEEIELIIKNKIRWITIFNKDYPVLLREIYLPPVVIYYQGCIEGINKSIAVIGSRKADGYALKVINKLVPELIYHGWNIVSGGALGADSFAHKVALSFNGRTTVVLGSGLLKPYPSSNAVLFKKISERNGAILTPFSMRTLAKPYNFPARNRIISGISKGCLVVQAAEKSGTFITAKFALDQGREVFAIPGNLTNKLSIGCNKLIQAGAKLVNSAKDILDEI